MLVRFLLLLLTYSIHGREYHEQDELRRYNHLLDLLYEKYKVYKRNQFLRSIQHDSDYEDYSNQYGDNLVGGRNIAYNSNSFIPIHDDLEPSNADKRRLVSTLGKHTPVHDDKRNFIQQRPSISNLEEVGRMSLEKNDHDVMINDYVKIGKASVKNNKREKENSNARHELNSIHSNDGVTVENFHEANDNVKHKKTFHSNAVEAVLEEKSNMVDANNPGKAKSSTEVLSIKMPNVAPKHMDTYLCYPLKLPEDDRYIVEYIPKADMNIVHHMLVYSCEEPYKKNEVWNCREMAPVCQGGKQLISYAWAKNAPPLKMPKDTGVHVGGSTGIRYLVMQLHYLHVSMFKNGKTDSSGLDVVLDRNKKRYLAGIYLLVGFGTPILPHKKVAHINMGCRYSGRPRLFPFRFRVHAHKLGVVITGYRVRHGKWTMIGKGDPQKPQAFYRVFNDVDVKTGDVLIGRCTYNSMSRNTTTFIGATHSDEMCNFYIMYFYDSRKFGDDADVGGCNYFDEDIFSSIPANSDIPLMEYQKEKRKYFGTKGAVYSAIHKWPLGGPGDGILPSKVGQICGVDLTKNNREVVILHRANRVWDEHTFIAGDLISKYQDPIAANTLKWLDRKTGAIKKDAGRNLFYLPHGITIDHKKNLWITDVGAHQVFKLNPQLEVIMVLGKKFEWGSGPDHFCKPTDVAVMKNGDFFVSDGYCNSRVVKFNKHGKLLLEISAVKPPNKGLFKNMSIVHSLALDEHHKRLYVADRENARILVFDTNTGKYVNSIHDIFRGAVYAVAFNKMDGGVLHFVTGPLNGEPYMSGYTYSLKSKSIISKWAPNKGFSKPHDLAVSKDNVDLFVSEIGPDKIWKFSRKDKTRP